jgi:hypothetical protein
MTQDAPHLEMRIFIQKLFINHISFIHFFRPDRGRSTRSPFPLARRQWRRLVHRFHQGIICMAHNTTIRDGSKAYAAKKQNDQKD